VTHGIAALEYAPFASGAIWDWATALGVIPVVYAHTGLKQKVKNPDAFFDDALCLDEIFSNTFVHVAGHIRAFLPEPSKYTEEYGRFQPRHRPDFIYLCDHCRSGWPALVAPGTAMDDEALRTFQNFVPTAEEIFLNEAVYDKPIVEIVKTASIEIPWAYLICLTIKRAFTIFASEDLAVVNDFETHLRAYSGEYRIRERW
jgi:hypothetical protein